MFIVDIVYCTALKLELVGLTAITCLMLPQALVVIVKVGLDVMVERRLFKMFSCVV